MTIESTSTPAAADDTPDSHPLLGIAFLLLATTIFPLQDVIIKTLSGNYAVHQIVFMRSAFALPLVLVIARFEGQLRPLKIGSWPLQILRALSAFASYMVYYMALATIGLAETAAITFSTPIFVTLLAMPFLGEKVGFLRWIAVIMGLTGVIVMVQPGADVFEPAALLALLAAVFYAISIITTRKLGKRTNGGSMTIITSVIYLIAGAVTGLIFSNIAVDTPHPSLAFLFRSWALPGAIDFLLMAAIGVTAAIGFFALAQAYRVAEASVVTPFEYTYMPWSVLWGWVFFATLPDLTTWIGLTLVISAGLLIVFREAIRGRKLVRRKGLGVMRQR